MMRKSQVDRCTLGGTRALVGKFSLVFGLGLTVMILGGCPPSDMNPPGNVSGLTAIEGDTNVDLSWTNPTDTDFAGVLILRKADGYPADFGDGIVVYQGTAVLASDTGLTNGTKYYYKAFTYDGASNYSSGVEASATPTVGAASADIVDELDNTVTMARDQWGSSLDAADSSYRSGDPCGAAEHLAEYESDAQDLRQSADTEDHMGTFEELYVAGRRVRYEMVSTSSAKDLCAGQERVGMQAAAAVDEDHSDNTELETTVAFGEPMLVATRQDGKVFTRIEIPGCDNQSGEPGGPAVPVFRRLIAVPQGAQVQVECTWDEAETIHLNVLPTQEAPVDQGLPPVPGTAPDASVFADKPFTINAALYAIDEPFPAETCTMTDLGELRDIHTYLMEVPAGRYSALSDSLTLFRNINIRTTFEGGNGVFATGRIDSAFEGTASLYAPAYLNESAIRRHLGEIGIFANIGEEFMILAPPQYRAAADTLATWKNSKGLVTRVFNVGAGTDYPSKESIVELIKDRFNTAHIRPAYVLLLGNTSSIPCFYVAPNGDVGAPTIATDWPYTAFGLFGILPQVALGRLPVRSLADANFVVSRIVAYEKTPPVDADFYAHAAIAAQFQCCTTTGFIGTDQRTFIRSAEFARNAMNAGGKTVDRIYRETVDAAYPADSTPRRDGEGWFLPAEIGPGSGFNWAATTGNVSAAWNAGRFLILHRDHGWPGGWGDPPFDWSNADALTNGEELPVVFSVNCASGLFDQETGGGALSTMAGIPYFAERLLTNRNGGAIGVLGDSRNSPSWANSALARGFIDAIWPNALPEFGDGTSHRRLGDILTHGKLYLFSQGGLSDSNITWSDVGDEFRMWHCLGDPTLEIWTKNPRPFALEQVVSVGYLQRVLFAEYGTEGATLTAFQRDGNQALQPIGRGTVENGVAQFELVSTPEEGAAVFIAATLDDAVSEAIESTIPDATPPGDVINFQATVGNVVQATLTWINPIDNDFAGVKIQQKTGGYPTSPDDGTTVYNGAGTQFVDNTVYNNQTFYYRAFAYDTSNHFAPGAQASVAIFLQIVN